MKSQLDNNITDSLEGLPTPYPLQRDILLSPAKRKVIACGRRVGKTITASMSAIGGERYGSFGLLDGIDVVFGSMSQKQTDVFWDNITSWLQPLNKLPNFKKNETRRYIKYNGGSIRVHTVSNPDALLSFGANKLILDECARLLPEVWTRAGAPLLATTDGVAEFYSTPNRRNWFFELFNYACDDMNTDWQAWHFSTLENPYISEQALAALISDMTESDYQQDILADFLESGGSVFRYVDERCILEKQQPYPGNFVAGIDWAQVSDYTVIMVMDSDKKQLVDYDRFHGVDWSLQRGRVKVICDKWKIGTIIAEHNSIGGPNIEALQKEGLPIQPFITTPQSKPPLIESLILAFDRDEIKVINDTIIKNELKSYERVITSTGRSQYNAPSGLHDDCVIALALAWYGCTRPKFTFDFV